MSSSRHAIKIFAKFGAHLVPIAMPEVCLKQSGPKLKMLSRRIMRRISVRTSLFMLGGFSWYIRLITLWIPSSCGICRYSECTSNVSSFLSELVEVLLLKL